MADASKSQVCSCGAMGERAYLTAPVMCGLTHAGEDAWNHHGMWGSAAGRDSRQVREARQRLEAGRGYLPADRAKMLAYTRLRETAAQHGMSEAEDYDRGLQGLMDKADRIAAGKPEPVKINGKRALKMVKDTKAGRGRDAAIHRRVTIERA